MDIICRHDKADRILYTILNTDGVYKQNLEDENRRCGMIAKEIIHQMPNNEQLKGHRTVFNNGENPYNKAKCKRSPK